ncbi:NAD(P)H-hydrate dehydratase [Bdellovibrio sp. SKB1291214]|uniref:NAD(P)H-hydrate dehydratase n=1 Tax=Bdellovibrio sp. SKB1291214 TaxID=1732569 RepID=UPI000B51589A|nr:NAD(P)H-hydrate dehydratase [Bdellovibrio sp. SKB1291214]UYL09138.1 NAD(P)H-hydrate dehydratase [Bdellovibrio sp. SKB1291214]
MKTTPSSVRILRKQGAANLLPAVSSADNKSSRGKSLIMAGSASYPGAGVLASKAALRMGSGYVILAQPDLSVSAWDHPDFILKDLSVTSWKSIEHKAVLLGPGFGVNNFTAKLIRELKSAGETHVILDADALTVVAQEKIHPLPASWILTPHTGELSRLIGKPADEINRDRISAAKLAQKKFGCVVLLKGHKTLIATKKDLATIATGNSALAKAGTGDVLAGIMTALRAQNMNPADAALLAAYIHGATANLWVARRKDPLSMMASDVIELVPEVLFQLRKLKNG